MYEWLFFEQYSHEPYIATVRFWVKYAGKAEEKKQEIVERTARGYAALGVMEKALATTPFLVGEQPTLADIALYAYTHVAPEGGFSLDGLPRHPPLARPGACRPRLRADAVPRLSPGARVCRAGAPGRGSGVWCFPGSSSGWCLPSPGTGRCPVPPGRCGWPPRRSRRS